MKHLPLALLCLALLSAPLAARQDDGTELSPARYFALWQEAEAHRDAGEWPQAAEIYGRLAASRPGDGELLNRLGEAFFRAGKPLQALSVGTEALDRGWGIESEIAYSIAQGMAGAGQKGAALGWLERALAAGFRRPANIKTEPAFQPFHDDPRFRRLAGLPPATADDAPALSREQAWRFDLDYLLAEIRRLHAAPSRVAHGDELAAAFEALKGRIGELSDEAMAVEIERLLAMLGDGHTGLYFRPSETVDFPRLPLRFYFFPEGLYVVAAAEGHDALVGSRVVAINGKRTKRVLEDLAPLTGRDNEQGLRWTGPAILRWTPALVAMGYGERTDAAVLTVEAADGTRREVEVATGEGEHAHLRGRLMPPSGTVDGAAPLWLSRPDDAYWHRRLPESSTVYAQVNQVFDQQEGPSLADFAAEIGRELAATKAENLILDVRRNGGGNNFLIWPLVRTAIAHEMAGPDHRVFVITGRRTFSAAQNLINFLERSTNAVFVGETSSSRPNFTGETTRVELPHSGLLASVSSLYWQDSTPMDRRPYISPVIPVDLTAADYFANRDPVMAALAEVLDPSTQ